VEAAEYERMAEVEQTHWWYAATRALLRQELAPHLKPGGTFLDAGGGTGATGAWLADFGRVVCADFETGALVANRTLHPNGAGFASADVQKLPFADQSFDATLCVTVLCHQSIPRPVEAVRELARVTRPGGIVCLWEPGVRRLRRAHDRVTHSARRFSLADLQGAATGAGLTVERATGAHSYLIAPAAVKAVIERGQTASDLASHQDGLGGLLAKAAAAERGLLRRTRLPFGLSVMVVARTPR
jgi:ubiquinone/menaquinone biosynthesis C-methylase UbiE